jgi:hypothetical protein
LSKFKRSIVTNKNIYSGVFMKNTIKLFLLAGSAIFCSASLLAMEFQGKVTIGYKFEITNVNDMSAKRISNIINGNMERGYQTWLLTLVGSVSSEARTKIIKNTKKAMKKSPTSHTVRMVLNEPQKKRIDTLLQLEAKYIFAGKFTENYKKTTKQYVETMSGWCGTTSDTILLTKKRKQVNVSIYDVNKCVN